MNLNLVEYTYNVDNQITLFEGDCLELLKKIPNESISLIITSPPYNIGKEYEKKQCLETYIDWQKQVIEECVRVLKFDGSICWQVGNYINKGEVIPLDILIYPIFKSFNLKLRNRIIWHFGHGLHAKKRFSGRYETILWFTKSDSYYFNLDPIRIPQKYPLKKHFKGLKKGELSCNPLGKNPTDVWDIPNVKHNHIEKTSHPCQFPTNLVERLILSMTKENDTILDPFVGSGTTLVSCLLNNRKGIGSENYSEYINITKSRLSNILEKSL